MSTLMRRRAVLLSLTMGAGMLGAQAMRPRELVDEARAAVPLETLIPEQIGPWQSDSTLDTFVRPAKQRARVDDIYDQVLERSYVRADGARIMMAVAYGREQTVALQVHRPEVCYEMAGYQVSDVQRADLQLATRTIAARRLRAHKPGRVEPITYWIVLGDEVVADAQEFRRSQFTFGVRGRIPDGMLVRLSSIDANQERAWQAHAQFAALIDRELPPAARARVMGA